MRRASIPARLKVNKIHTFINVINIKCSLILWEYKCVIYKRIFISRINPILDAKILL
jgi:hypothetical protein